MRILAIYPSVETKGQIAVLCSYNAKTKVHTYSPSLTECNMLIRELEEIRNKLIINKKPR